MKLYIRHVKKYMVKYDVFGPLQKEKWLELAAFTHVIREQETSSTQAVWLMRRPDWIRGSVLLLNLMKYHFESAAVITKTG